MEQDIKNNEQIRKQLSFSKAMLDQVAELTEGEGLSIQEYIKFLIVKDLREQSLKNAQIYKTIKIASEDMQELKNFQKDFRESIKLGKLFLYLKRKYSAAPLGKI